MNINLIKKIKHNDVDVGDILIFSNGESYDYYQVIFNQIDDIAQYQLLSLSDFTIRERYKDIENMIALLKCQCKNGYELTSIVKSKNLTLGRTTND